MFDVRIHGRGGQGVVTAAELLSVAVADPNVTVADQAHQLVSDRRSARALAAGRSVMAVS